MSVPAAILQIMENEYSNMCLEILQVVCDEYNLDIEDVKKKLKGKLALTFELNEQKLNYRFVQRAPPRPKEDKETCIANMFDFTLKTSRRCTRPKQSSKGSSTPPECSLFCSTHLRMHYTGRLAYGVAEGYQKEYDDFCLRSEHKKDVLEAPPSTQSTPKQLLRKQVIRKIK